MRKLFLFALLLPFPSMSAADPKPMQPAARCLLYPIAWVGTEHPAEWMWTKLPERVKPFKHHLVGANWSVDKKPDWRGYGFSVVISNEGKVLASAKSLYGSEIVYAELPFGK